MEDEMSQNKIEQCKTIAYCFFSRHHQLVVAGVITMRQCRMQYIASLPANICQTKSKKKTHRNAHLDFVKEI